MATTTNYGWTTPDDTALVSQGAAAIRTLGSSVDTTVKALSPGTTAGDVDYYTSSTAKARLGIGSTGQVLTVAAGIPSWGSGSGMTLLSTTTLSGSSTSLGTIPAGYVDLRLYIVNYKPSTDGALMQLRYNADGANSYKVRSANESGVSGFTSTIGMVYGNDNSVATGLGAMTIYNYANSTTWKTSEWLNVTVNSTTTTNFDIDKSYGFWNGTAAITNITFYPSGGTFTSGTILLYGVK
jgi:hypothetical protein